MANTWFVVEPMKPVLSTDLQIFVITETLFRSLIVTDFLRTVCNSNIHL